jgi:hypothetical protein
MDIGVNPRSRLGWKTANPAEESQRFLFLLIWLTDCIFCLANVTNSHEEEEGQDAHSKTKNSDRRR